MRKFLIAALSSALAVGLAVSASADPAGKHDKSGKPAPRAPAASGPSGPRERGGPPSRRSYRPLTPEQEKEVLDYLKKRQPDIHKQLLEQREEDRYRYSRTLRWVWYGMERRKRLPEKVRDAYDVRQRTHVQMWKLAKELEKAKGSALRDDLERQLSELAGDYFQAEQTIREYRLKQLEDQIKRLREDLEDRLRKRKSVIQEIIERMKSEAAKYSRPRTRPPGGGPTTRPAGPPGRGPRRPSGKPDKPKRDG